MKFELLQNTAKGAEVKGRECLEAEAGCISRFFFWWTGQLVKRGYNKPLSESDLTDVLEEEKLTASFARFRETRKACPRLTFGQALHRCTRGTFYLIFGLTNLAYLLQFAGPILVGKIVGFISSRNSDEGSRLGGEGERFSDAYGLMLGALLLGSSVIRLFLQQHAMHHVNRYSVYINSILSGVIYNRVLLMPTAIAHTTDSGKIINLMNVDTQNIYMFTQMMYWILICPAVIAASSVILYLQVGLYGLIGPVLLFVGIFLQERLQKKTAEYKKKQMEFTDQRSKMLTEYFNNMKMVKFNCLETFLERSNKTVRAQEIGFVFRAAVVLGLVEVLAAVIPLLIIVIIFSIHILLENELTAEKAFTVLGLFSMIFLPLKQSAVAGLRYSSAKVSLQRIAEFDKGSSFLGRNVSKGASGLVVKFDEASFSWKETQSHSPDVLSFSLDDIKDSKASQAGKAKLLSSETNERQLFDSPESKSPQRLRTDEERQNCVLSKLTLSVERGEFIGVTGPTGSGKSSFLQAILQELPHVEGESLIAAQRISYSSQSNFIFNDSIRANILFFNELDEKRYEQVLKACELIEDLSSFPKGDLTNTGDAGTKLSVGQKQRIALARCIYADAELYLIDNSLSSVDSRVTKKIFRNLRNLLESKTVLLVTQNSEILKLFPRILHLDQGHLVQDEIRPRSQEPYLEEEQGRPYTFPTGKLATPGSAEQKGAIPTRVYLDYFCSSGVLPLILVSLIFALSQGARFMADWWLGAWSTKRFDYGIARNLTIYVVFAFLSGTALFVRSAVFFKISLHFSQKVNSKIMSVLMRTKLQWFDSTPVGQILARLVKDQDNLDNTLPSTILFNLTQVSMLFTVLITGGLASSWYFLIVAFVALVYISMVKYYIRAARESKRIELEAKGPIIAILNESVAGLAVIRAFERRQDFFQLFTGRCDALTVAMQNNLFCGRWIAFRSEFFGAVLISATTFLAILGDIRGQHVDQVILGLALSFSLQINVLLACLIRSLATIETQMTSAQRIFSVIQNNPQNESEENDVYLAPGTPLDIEICNCSFQYSPQTEPVLRGITLTIRKGEKVAIVGRTGSGKSTLLLGVVGLLQRQSLSESSLRIAGVDIKDWPSRRLRQLVGIVPQESVLLTGTIRSNVDPGSEFTDAEVHSTLRKLGWKFDTTSGIHSPVADGGKSFSAGQKQLISLARAIKKKKEILIIDEGTSCLEEEAGEAIIRTLIRELSHVTMLFVTHRPKDVTFFSRVVLIHRGQIDRVGSPEEIAEELNRIGHADASE